ncbi:MAG: segregation/condensation protein A [Candidatus Pacebacteria bacterium]|nr:segregation/condensation protein A [Candidatus Paceibacterota bacterium]
MDRETFQIKTEVFEGPLDLLLSLIEKHKLHINDISLSKVTDDFIKYINTQENFPVEQSSDFILVASTLVLIKSKSLLPTLELTSEEESDIADLEQRLKEYKRIKELSRYVKERFGQRILFPKNTTRNIEPVFSPDEKMILPNLLSSIQSALASLPKIERLAKAVVQKIMSLEEMVGQLTERITIAIKISFREFSKHGNIKSKEDKVHVIVGFLAMLELVKQGIIRVSQDKLFEDIHMENESINTPKYQ